MAFEASTPDKIAGRRLGDIRRAAGWTVAEVAKQLQISVGAVKSHEKGARGLRAKRIAAYAKLYKVSPADILGDVSDSAPLSTDIHDAADALLTFDWLSIEFDTANHRTELQRLLNNLRNALKAKSTPAPSPDLTVIAAQLHAALDDLYLFVCGEPIPGIYDRVEAAIDAYEAAVPQGRDAPHDTPTT